MDEDEMETTDLTLKAEVGLHQSCMEGRKGYGTGIRPNHWIPGRDYTFLGQIEFSDRDLLKPGESCEATINCIVASQDKELFKPGFAWHICEANKIMGYAKVLSC
ncbi:hypothetical protein [Shewanella algae]|uniref:hypothetical protein n=1 Tax=Shewanella algae TaxID=38313 RepID=UPI0031F55680